MATPENPPVVAIDNKANFNKRWQETRTDPKLLVLAFMATWNESSKVMKPTFEGFASQFKGSADFRTVDVDDLQEVAREAKVEALPTFLLVKNGKVVNRVVGAKGAELRSSIDKYKMATPENPPVVAIDNKANFNKRLQETRTDPKLLVLEFTAGWSEPCKAMKPTVEGFASQFKDSADFCTVDVEVNELQALVRNLGVETLPTFLLAKGGKVVSKVVDAKGAELRSSIDKYK